jgi:hypothetical protein
MDYWKTSRHCYDDPIAPGFYQCSHYLLNPRADRFAAAAERTRG